MMLFWWCFPVEAPLSQRRWISIGVDGRWSSTEDKTSAVSHCSVRGINEFKNVSNNGTMAALFRFCFAFVMHRILKDNGAVLAFLIGFWTRRFVTRVRGITKI
jgi:hypothetical protein